MASFPSQVANFPTHVNITEIIDASHPNNIQNEVVAVETTLGTNPNVSTTPSSSDTFIASSTTFSTVKDRLANIESGIVSDAHIQYIRKSGDTGNVIIPAAISTKGLVIKAASGQTANLQEWQNSSGVAITFIDSTGALNGTASGNVPLSTVTAAGDLIVGSGSSTVARLGSGAQGTVLYSNGSSLYWSSTIQGTQGTRGLQGVQGLTGIQGAQGLQGVQGFLGPQGVQGNTGTQGTQGVQGLIGVQGNIGVQGIAGAVAAQGIQGVIGVQGVQGFTGIQGLSGTAVAQGAIGAQGIQGLQGFTGIQGPSGIYGSTGAQGTAGATGAQGAIGAIGANGIQGATGLQGFTGAQGLVGTQGSTGLQGITGSGTQGLQGLTGIQGVTGLQGANGAQGTAGTSPSGTATIADVLMLLGGA